VEGTLDRLVPKLVTTLAGYTRGQLLADLSAGIIVGIVALPLAIAFAIASGVGPERGLFTAIIAGFLISALGGSRVQIGGPTGAFVVIVYAIVQRHGVEGLAMATLMAGFILVGFGLARLGGAIKFIPYPVTIGFTSGIALIIFSGEVKDFLGLEGPVPAEFLARWRSVAAHFGSLNPWAVAVSVATLAIIVFWPRLNRRIPSPFVALIVTTAAVQLLHLPVDTIGSRFGVINASLPAPSLPAVSFQQIPGLMGAAFTIALLGAVESLLSAVVADGMIGGRHRSNMELVAQGVANIASPLFGGIPATGAIARTATNVRNGGRTPVAGVTHAVTLLLITLFFGRWAGLIPMAALAGILVVVAYSMSEWRTFLTEFRAPKSDVAVLLTTFLLTVLVDLTKTDVPYLNTVLVASRRFIKESPQQVESFLKGTIDGLAFLPNPANEKAVKSVLARRLKLNSPQSIQIMYDATLEMHAKTKVPNVPLAGVQNMIDALLRTNPRMAKLKAAELVDSSFIDRLEKSGYVQEAMKKN